MPLLLRDGRLSDVLLEIRQLTCERDDRCLIEALDLRVCAGDIVQVEGPNGSGKTTLLRVLCGLGAPGGLSGSKLGDNEDEPGEVYWRGVPLPAGRLQMQTELLYMGHRPAVKGGLTALENLNWMAHLGTVVPSAEQIAAVITAIGLVGLDDQPVSTLSAGQQRRVGLARLWLSNATLWILDEPFTAIDRAGVQRLEARLQAHAEAGGAVIITSHHALDHAHIKRLQLAEQSGGWSLQ